MKGDKSTMNNNDNRGGLKIQVEKKLFEFKLGNLLRLVGIIIISIICGALAAGYITSVYVSEIEETIIISQEDKQITDGIQKVLKSIVVTLAFISADKSPEQYKKTQLPKLVTVLGTTMEVRALQYSNALSPMDVTLSGIVISLSFVHL